MCCDNTNVINVFHTFAIFIEYTKRTYSASVNKILNIRLQIYTLCAQQILNIICLYSTNSFVNYYAGNIKFYIFVSTFPFVIIVCNYQILRSDGKKNKNPSRQMNKNMYCIFLMIYPIIFISFSQVTEKNLFLFVAVA